VRFIFYNNTENVFFHTAQATWKFYFANEKKESFNQSREWCKSRGGDLAKMESTLERKIVKCILNKKMIEEVWIGAFNMNLVIVKSMLTLIVLCFRETDDVTTRRLGKLVHR